MGCFSRCARKTVHKGKYRSAEGKKRRRTGRNTHRFQTRRADVCAP